MPPQNGEHTFEDRLERIETLVETIQAAANPALRTSAEELVQTLLDLHGHGLQRLLELVWEAGDVGERIIREDLPGDDLVSHLLLLHGLHPLPIEERVHGALERVRPYMKSHGGGVEVLSIADGVVRLRLEGNCESCPASAMTLKYAVEDAVYEAAPDVLVIETEAAGDAEAKQPPASAFVPLDEVEASANGAAPEKARWHRVRGLATLKERTPTVKTVAGRSVLFCRMGETLYAYGDACPACGQSLEDAALDGTALLCPHCDQSYDVIRAGRGLDTPSLHLAPIPLLTDGGEAKIALPEVAV